MASAIQTLLTFGGLFVGFSGDVNSNLLRKSDLRFDSAFSFSAHTESGLLCSVTLSCA